MSKNNENGTASSAGCLGCLGCLGLLSGIAAILGVGEFAHHKEYGVPVIIVSILFIWIFIKISSNLGKKREEYARTLAALQRDPSNKQLRNRLVSLGRWLIENYGEPYSEQSLSNDLMICLGGYGGNVSAPNIAEEIQKLAELHSKGIITQEEFERGKSLFLGAPKDKAHQTLEALVNLHQLMKQKVISESEYNVKKWELLSGKLIK